MVFEVNTELGKVIVPEDLIATIAGYAAQENYGLAGMRAKTAGDSITELFGGKDKLNKGVKVTALSPTELSLDLYVTLQYGVSLPAVAQNLISNVKYRVEDIIGITVQSVNIFVESIRVEE
ncbi:MAG: Asp23/Gls24 family envelope stress response protein [Clostridiales bacterium]|nr:Asp23/Gls24 family envelope stress response protein [Clostridiales bacterium]